MARVLALLLIIATAAACGPAFGQSLKKRGENPETSLRKKLAAYNKSPLSLFVAKGAPNSCGEGCDTWIAADGTLGPTAAQQLRKFLAEPPRASLPIFFNSAGGSVTQAIAIGRLLRQRKVTAGVAHTVPRDCASRPAREKACEALKRSGRELSAELDVIDAVCASACVYALIGAEVRQVAPYAKLGVHSSIMFSVYSDGSVTAAPAQRLRELNALTKRYVAEMGIDTGLFDAALATRHESIRYLTRDEIARFGIDTRKFHETQWIAEGLSSAPAALLKFFVEARGASAKEMRPSIVRIGCEKDTRLSIFYMRGLAAGEAEPSAAITLLLGDLKITFPQFAKVSKFEALEPRTLFEQRLTYESAEAFESAAAAARFEIVESDASEPGRSSHVTSLSTAGLQNAVGTLRQRCSKVAGSV